MVPTNPRILALQTPIGVGFSLVGGRLRQFLFGHLRLHALDQHQRLGDAEQSPQTVDIFLVVGVKLRGPIDKSTILLFMSIIKFIYRWSSILSRKVRI